jgi:Fe-S-cluster containining protein
MPFVDSVDKIVMTYFRSVTRDSFTYKDKVYEPRPLTVSPLILRGFTCPIGCGGCCPRFSLDYLPQEKRPDYVNHNRQILFNARYVEIYSDLQADHKDHFCRNLNKADGRCGVYGQRPFSCDFELIRFFTSEEKNRLSQQLFGRGWAFLRIDDGRGALCTMTAPDEATINETIRKLNRLQMWASHFSLRTWVPEIIDWIYTGDVSKHLRLS